ncbi:DUF2807 domain-containing protein [Hymenobacter sp. BT491]|nr:DUF2807 domain-containing protein [Hymenobacter sp. BT491]
MTMLLVAGAGLFSACQKDHAGDCFKSTGRIVTERRALAPFRQIVAYDNVDVILVPDTETYAEVRAGKNLQEDIELQVKGNQLIIHNTSRCNWVRRYNTPREVTLHTLKLTDLFLYGQGNIRTASNLRADTLFCHLVGSGDYDLDVTSRYLWFDMYELGDFALRGQAEEAHIIVGGSGTLNAHNLPIQRCYIQLNKQSSGDAHITATSQLIGTHAGTGTLYYTSAASTDIKISGTGTSTKSD